MIYCRSILTLFCFLIAITGCQVGPKYKPPEITVSNQWKNPSQIATTLPKVEHWWETFEDPMLVDLIQQAVSNNPSLMAAMERVEQARNISKITKSRLFPQLNFDPSYSNTPITTHQLGTTLQPPPSLIRDHLTEYALPLILLYEVDLWGKIRSQYQSALRNTEAKQAAYQTSLLLLTTDLANAYFQLRILDAQIELFESIISTRKTALEINSSRYKAKLINYNEVTESQIDLATVESEYYDARRNRALFENQIAVLIGISPSEFKLESMPLIDLPPVIPAGMPSKLLLRRPDLAEQERVMASLHAQINVAYASYFPSLDIKAGIQLFSKDFLKSPNVGSWLFGANLTESIFDANARHHNVNLTWAQFKEALNDYQQKVLNAFQEVEDVLSNLEWITKQIEAAEGSMNASKIAYNISWDRYKYGLADYRNVANQQRQELDQKRFYLKLLSMQYLNTIHLIKAIGGNWE